MNSGKGKRMGQWRAVRAYSDQWEATEGTIALQSAGESQESEILTVLESEVAVGCVAWCYV